LPDHCIEKDTEKTYIKLTLRGKPQMMDSSSSTQEVHTWLR
jgi:hypothetical protein